MGKNIQSLTERGPLFESVVINHAARIYPEIFFWYSAKEKKEVDLVIQHEGEIKLYEVKLSSELLRSSLNREVICIHPSSFETFLNTLP